MVKINNIINAPTNIKPRTKYAQNMLICPIVNKKNTIVTFKINILYLNNK